MPQRKAVRNTNIGSKRRSPLFFEIKGAKNNGLLSTKKLEMLNADRDEDNFDQEDESKAMQVPQKITKSILQLSKQQQQEEHADDVANLNESAARVASRMVETLRSKTPEGAEDDDYYDEEGEDEEVEISAEDEAMLNKYMGMGNSQGNLADIIMEKIHEAERKAAPGGGVPEVVFQVYNQVGHHLSFYKSGKVPKAFKLIPTLKNWEQVLNLTQPESWTPQATAAATRLFASNLKEKMAQRFFCLFLLPRIRQDIERNKKLNYHYMTALRFALFKPGAFFKGILLPIAMEDCSAREALIMAAFLRKASFPAIHGGLALYKISELPYSGPRFVLLKCLLNKKFSLPKRVIDHLVNVLCEFENDSRDLPVIWHQTLLVLVQRYRASISEEGKNRIRNLIKVHSHAQISPEIKRELTQLSVEDIDMK